MRKAFWGILAFFIICLTFGSSIINASETSSPATDIACEEDFGAWKYHHGSEVNANDSSNCWKYSYQNQNNL